MSSLEDLLLSIELLFIFDWFVNSDYLDRRAQVRGMGVCRELPPLSYISMLYREMLQMFNKQSGNHAEFFMMNLVQN